jgi:hypothetical protein
MLSKRHGSRERCQFKNMRPTRLRVLTIRYPSNLVSMLKKSFSSSLLVGENKLGRFSTEINFQASLWVKSNPSMPVRHYASMPVCQYASIPVCQYDSIPVCQYASMPVWYSNGVGSGLSNKYWTRTKITCAEQTL